MLPCYHIPIPMFSCYHCNSKKFSRGSHLKKKPLDQAAILSPLPSFLPTPPSQNCQNSKSRASCSKLRTLLEIKNLARNLEHLARNYVHLARSKWQTEGVLTMVRLT